MIEYLNESDVPRACHCLTEAAVTRALRLKRGEDCPYGCPGTGRLGNPEGPRVEVWFYRKFDSAPIWRWSVGNHTGDGSFPTAAAALEAAREAHRGAN